MPEIDVGVTAVYMAWDTANLEGRTGDDGNHTLRGVSDVTEFTPGNAPVEIDNTNLQGLYRLTLTAGENDGEMMTLGGESSTADVVIIPVQWTNKVNVTQIEGLDATDQIRDSIVDDATRFAGADIAAIVVDVAAVDAAVAAIDAIVTTIAADVVAITAIVTTIAANVVIILARIGAFTGTGVNTILGFLRAMSRNDLAAPSDMGGTYNPILHSLQALRNLFIRAECAGTVSADELTIVRGDSYDSDDDNAIEGLGDISTYTKIWITAKHSKDQVDAESIFMVLLSNPAVPLTDGLQYLNGAESDALDAASLISRDWGAITISDAVAGDIAFTLDEAATDDLVPSELAYDIQWTDGTDVETVRDDRVTITADVTRAIV